MVTVGFSVQYFECEIIVRTKYLNKNICSILN